jgi:hypothetical protein
VECTPDKRVLFEAAGANVVATGGREDHPWAYPAEDLIAEHGQIWKGSKPAHNLSQPPLPLIGSQAELWDEYCRERIEVNSFLPAQAVITAEQWLAELPRPVVLLHTKANTSQARKSFPDEITVAFYRALLDRMNGSLILLDWDDRVPRLNSWRVRHLDDLGKCPTEVLLALMTQSDLLIGVDSGPLHLARFTKTPTVGVWMPGHYPARYSLPRQEQLNVVLAEPTAKLNRFKRIPWVSVASAASCFLRGVGENPEWWDRSGTLRFGVGVGFGFGSGEGVANVGAAASLALGLFLSLLLAHRQPGFRMLVQPAVGQERIERRRIAQIA